MNYSFHRDAAMIGQDRGMRLCKEGKTIEELTEGISLLQRSVDAAPDFAKDSHYIWLANANREMKNKPEEIKWLQKAFDKSGSMAVKERLQRTLSNNDY